MTIDNYLLSTEVFRTIVKDLDKVLEMAAVLEYKPQEFTQIGLIKAVTEEPYKTVTAIHLLQGRSDAMLIKQEEIGTDKCGYVLYTVSKDNQPKR